MAPTNFGGLKHHYIRLDRPALTVMFYIWTLDMPRKPNAAPQTLSVLDLLLERPEDWHYGYDISRRSGLKSGTLYPILIRLADNGWLETRWAEPERPGRPPRHTYRLTAEGVRAAKAALARLPEGRPVLRPPAEATGE